METQQLYDSKSKLQISFDDSGRIRTHTINQPDLKAVNQMEAKFPGFIIQQGTKMYQEANLIDRSILLYNLLIESIDGYSFKDKADWKERVPAYDKQAIINEITAAQFITPDDIKTFYPDYLIPENPNDETIFLFTESKQLGNNLVQRHELQKPGIEDIKEYQKVMALTHVTEHNSTRLFSKATADTICAIYSRLVVSTQGYSIDAAIAHGPQIPVFHRLIIINNMMNRSLVVINNTEKNSSRQVESLPVGN